MIDNPTLDPWADCVFCNATGHDDERDAPCKHCGGHGDVPAFMVPAESRREVVVDGC